MKAEAPGEVLALRFVRVAASSSGVSVSILQVLVGVSALDSLQDTEDSPGSEECPPWGGCRTARALAVWCRPPHVWGGGGAKTRQPAGGTKSACFAVVVVAKPS